jgi:hypothetical protein
MNWACPRCGAKANEHGAGGAAKCKAGEQRKCQGFLCECGVDTDDDHGESLATPCPNACCYHCGWYGTFPAPPRKAKTWEKKALLAGWTPPEGWDA